MKAQDFLAEFDETDFPCELGRHIRQDDHDPPFTTTQLKQMAKQGLIVLTDDGVYRLTLKASAIKARGKE